MAISDIVAGQFASSAILAALLRRGRTGEGATLEVSLLDAQVAWLANRGGDWLIGGIEPVRLGNAHPSIVPYETFRAADGYVNLAVGTDEQFARFCREAGLDELADDPDLTTNRLRVVNRDRLVPALQTGVRGAAGRRTGSACSTAPGVPGGPVLSVPETLWPAPPRTPSRRSTHPTAGPLKLIGSPMQVDGERLLPACRRRGSASTRPRCSPRPATPTTRSRELVTGACAPG